MNKPWITLVACLLCGIVNSPSALAGNTIVGANVVSPDTLNDHQQDELVEQLVQAGVRTIRTGMVNERYVRFITRAFKRGISSIAIVYPTQGAPGAHMRPADPSLGIPWRVANLSDTDPEGFSRWLGPILADLEAAGVHLTALELGNEINTPNYNGDFPLEGTRRILGLSDLNNPNDSEGRAIAESYRAYLRAMAVLKSARDASKLNRTTPIISAGLADSGLPRPHPGSKLDEVSIPDSIAFLRQNGLDKLADGYGVHVYPSDDPRMSQAERLMPLDKDVFAGCRQSTKPCWLTEWGFTNNNSSCPPNDQARTALVETERKAFKHFADQGRLAAAIYYSWTGIPGTQSGFSIFRCGAVTTAGKLALSPL